MARPFDVCPPIGTKFDYLTLDSLPFSIHIAGRNVQHVHCVCICGNKITTSLSKLKNKKKRSCGCLKAHQSTAFHYKNGYSRTKEYRAWNGMIKRCYDSRYKLFHRYGGRGIKVCDEWINSFEEFINDVGWCNDARLSLERINNDGNYEKGNVKWATAVEQSNNRSTNLFFEINGETKTLKQWCDVYQISYKCVYSRIKQLNYDIKEALTKPIFDTKFKNGHYKNCNK